MTPTARLASRILRRAALVIALFFFVACNVFADDVIISDETFDCMVNWLKMRNTRIKNQDPQSLERAMRIFQDSVANVEYPAGTILQLVPYEAMVKRSAGTFPKTHGREFFSLDVSGSATKIRDRGDNVVNIAQGVTCFSCHSAAEKYDFVCEEGHGCAPIPFNDEQIARVQEADSRCTKK
jgi:hypothetical protein